MQGLNEYMFIPILITGIIMQGLNEYMFIRVWLGLYHMLMPGRKSAFIIIIIIITNIIYEPHKLVDCMRLLPRTDFSLFASFVDCKGHLCKYL